MHHKNSSADSPLLRIALGAAAGVVGTFALRGVMMARAKVAPSTQPTIAPDPGEYFTAQATRVLPRPVRRHIPDAAKKAGALALASGYGMTYGALYGALRPGEKKLCGHLLADGAVLGLGAWAVGYLGWLPAGGFTPYPWQQRLPRSVGPALDHVIYGILTAGAYEMLRELI